MTAVAMKPIRSVEGSVSGRHARTVTTIAARLTKVM